MPDIPVGVPHYQTCRLDLVALDEVIMATSLFKFSEVEAKRASPATLNAIIKDVLRANNDACYIDLERFLLPPGVSGSKTFDQAYAVERLLEHDVKNGKRLATAMKDQGLSHRLIWDRLYAVLRAVGFQMKHGRLVGLLEDQTVKNDDEIGQPDIE
jgi:hypothetical protein